LIQLKWQIIFELNTLMRKGEKNKNINKKI